MSYPFVELILSFVYSKPYTALYVLLEFSADNLTANRQIVITNNILFIVKIPEILLSYKLNFNIFL